MCRHNNLKHLFAKAFLQSNMATSLSYHRPTISLESSDDLLVGKAGNFVHTSTSSTKVFSFKIRSSSAGSRYNWMASLIL